MCKLRPVMSQLCNQKHGHELQVCQTLQYCLLLLVSLSLVQLQNPHLLILLLLSDLLNLYKQRVAVPSLQGCKCSCLAAVSTAALAVLQAHVAASPVLAVLFALYVTVSFCCPCCSAATAVDGAVVQVHCCRKCVLAVEEWK